MIGVDSQAAIQATRSMCGASGHHLVDRVHEQIWAALRKHRGLKVELRWIPGHMGVQENEWADEEAKKAAMGDSSDGMQLPMACRGALLASRLGAQQSLLKELGKKSKLHFEVSHRCQRTCLINPSTPSPRFRKTTQQLTQRQVVLLVQL